MYMYVCCEVSVSCNLQKVKLDTKLLDSHSPDEFVNLPPANRLCVKCGRVPWIPMRSKCCDRLYCEPCSLENKRCWKHKALIQYSMDMELRGRIKQLRRKCPNQSKGCKWKGKGWQVKRHVQEDCLQSGETSLLCVWYIHTLYMYLPSLPRPYLV